MTGINGTRKFVLSAFASLVCSVAIFTGHLSGGEWIAAQTLILALYKVANVADKKLGGAG